MPFATDGVDRTQLPVVIFQRGLPLVALMDKYLLSTFPAQTTPSSTAGVAPIFPFAVKFHRGSPVDASRTTAFDSREGVLG